MTETSLEQLVDGQIDFRLSSLYTALLCEITQIRDTDRKELKIDVQPIVNKVYKDGEIQEYPQILSVPVKFPRSSRGGVTFPLVKGDTVLVVFAKNNIDVFKQGATSSHDPNDTRCFSIRDAIAIPCVFPFSTSPDKYVTEYSQEDVLVVNNVGKENECGIRLKGNGSISITTATDVSVNALNASVQAPNISVVGNTTFTGNVAVTGTFTLGGAATFAGISTFNGALVSSTTTTLTGTATYNGSNIATT